MDDLCTNTLPAILFIPTAPSAAPENVLVVAENSTTLSLSWQPPPSGSINGIIQHYIINITEVNTGTTFQLETNNLYVTVQNLHPYYQYRCTVAAETVGLGPFSITVTINMPEDGKK